jgi:hypothetical protein
VIAVRRITSTRQHGIANVRCGAQALIEAARPDCGGEGIQRGKPQVPISRLGRLAARGP